MGARRTFKDQPGQTYSWRPSTSVALVFVAQCLASGCQPADSKAKPATSSASAPPSKVAGSVKESDLATVTLTDQAEKRLGIKAIPVERKPLPLAVSYGGEVMIPQGRLIS